MPKIKPFFIYTVSLLIPIAVGLLTRFKISGYDFGFLPGIYTLCNALTAVLLLVALVAIRQKKLGLHRTMMYSSLGLSVVFLLCYVVYHATSDPVPYIGAYPKIYYPLLISHIVLSGVVLPFVLFSLMYAENGDFPRHRQLVRWAFPLWWYVAVTGVVVYYMLY